MWSSPENKVFSLSVLSSMYLWCIPTLASLAGSFRPEQVKPCWSQVSCSNRISLLRCSVAFICKCQHSCDVISPLFCFLKWVHTCTSDVSQSKSHYHLFMVLLFVWWPFWCIHQNKKKENSINATEFNEEEPRSKLVKLTKKSMPWKPSRSAIPATRRVWATRLGKQL